MSPATLTQTEATATESMTLTADSVRVALRFRTLGPSGLNPPQIKVLDRLQTLSEDEDGPVTELDVDIWGASIGITQTAERDPADTREMVAEFRQWADAYGYRLQPAFAWHSSDSKDTGNGQIVTPLITLAVYNETGERLQAVYPHVDGEDVQTIHDGVEALESMPGPEDTEQADDEQNEKEDLAVPSSNTTPLLVD
ncbi:HTH domain-containing protein [Halalkalicoccus salilacus]|uniref:HTH domain-containing protein n=1 Tax=Halalkalicoccus sp. GCM10025704 TaxID=3252662 RepID=UPI0036F44702